MLVQLTDELSPVLAANGNTVILRADENLSVYGDSDKLARASNTGGSGLGLAIAKEIVNLHGETITAHSERETVSFHISLPKL